jgi:DNA-binding NarL/FixJ family response regulator
VRTDLLGTDEGSFSAVLVNGRETMSGPLQVLAVSFGPGADFAGRVLDEVDRLQGRNMLRVLDMLFLAKTESGDVEQVSFGDDEDFGALLASIVPLGAGGVAAPHDGNGASGFDQADALALADSLSPGTSLAFLLVEHRWAAPLFDAIEETGGTLLGEGFLTPEAGLLVGAEVAAMEEAAQVIAAAQAAEAEAALRAFEAGVEAEEAVAESEAIRSAAAAEAARALIAAGLVEEAAAHEAVEALAAAGLIVRGSDQAAAEALAEGGATVRAASITVAEARVLRYLPTTLPFAVIADKLGISRSAAKDRAERVYRKLEVHSREAAVDRARELGLLDTK